MGTQEVSKSTLRRLPVYLHFLNSIKDMRTNISASAIAEEFELNDVQVRKDLGSVSGSGRPKTGYDVNELISQIEDCLGYRTQTGAVLIGAGHLGKALLSFSGFADYGLNIVAAFDTAPDLVGSYFGGKPVYPMERVEEICEKNKIRLAILTTPVGAAQEICDRLVLCGVKAIWNFTPTILKGHKDVLIENENLASSLAILSKHLREEKRG